MKIEGEMKNISSFRDRTAFLTSSRHRKFTGDRMDTDESQFHLDALANDGSTVVFSLICRRVADFFGLRRKVLPLRNFFFSANEIGCLMLQKFSRGRVILRVDIL